jgi:glycosyltransferase involved in cell wall biosynthesis
MTPSKLFINATNIHFGGGKRLLIELLNFLPKNSDIYVFLDTRFPLTETQARQDIHVHLVKPSLLNKILTDFKIFFLSKSNDRILYLSNLPPVIKLRGRLHLFIQNRLIIESGFYPETPLKFKIKLFILRLWFKLFLRDDVHLLVQTHSMANQLRRIGIKNDSTVCPYAPSLNVDANMISRAPSSANAERTFFYPSDTQPHKNLKTLIKAWCQMSESPHKNKLILTVSLSELSKDIQNLVASKNPNIEFLGAVPYEKLLHLYTQVDALIFPSLCESLGLPLVEAQMFQLPILASDRDFVHEVCPEALYFNPLDVNSITETVIQFGHNKNKHPTKNKSSFPSVKIFLELINAASV